MGPEGLRKLTKEEEQDAQIGLLEWELQVRDEQHGVDPLTGLKTREVFERELGQALKTLRGDIEEKRESEKFKHVSLVYIDIDYFKRVNDTLGHRAGDEVLQKIAALLQGSVRGGDLVARTGGEEMMILMRGADAEGAARHAEELRGKIEQLEFERYPDLKVTASFGVISSAYSTDADALKEGVDKALYRAKNAGRNQVAIA